jgi:hypothetical protein
MPYHYKAVASHTIMRTILIRMRYSCLLLGYPSITIQCVAIPFSST